MTTPTNTQANSAETPVLDADLVRAQVANALFAAGRLMAEHVDPAYFVSYVRLRIDGAVFWAGPPSNRRLYDFVLLSADGRHARLFRITPEGETLSFDETDKVLTNAIGNSLSATVHQLYLAHFPENRTTHPGSPTVH
jgi:hypothetical protein